VWALSGNDAIANRSRKLITEAKDEVVLVLGEDTLLTEDLITTLTELNETVDVLVGAVTESLEREIHNSLPEATTFVSGLGWMRPQAELDDDLVIGRLLLVDRSNILVSTIVQDTRQEQAIFGGGFRNGLIVIARRLLSQGLVHGRDPRGDQ
jgi:sugar-specific transcriptional regulator TrmB